MNELDLYIDSGIIEAYCLGSLPSDEAAEVTVMAGRYPEVEQAITQTLALLEQYPQSPAPSAGLKTRVLDFLDQFLESEKIDLENPPLIHLHSDVQAWNQALQNLGPEHEESGFTLRVLKESNHLQLSVVWLSDKMVETKHATDEFQESFFILEGECECDFEGKVVRFGAGDYFDIPPNTDHTIKNISTGLSYVKGLVQRRKAA